MPARRTPQRTKPTRSVERMSISDEGTNATTEEEEEEEEEEEQDEDERGSDDDRGDHVDDGSEEDPDEEDPDEEEEEEEDPDEEEEESEDDPDEEEEEEEEDEEEEPSEEDLNDLANGGTVPLGRLNQVLEQNRQLTEAVLAMTASGGTKPKKDDAPAFDLPAKIRERNKFLIDGDEDKAAAVDLEIEQHRQEQADARATANVTGVLAKQAIDSAVKSVRTTFPALNPQSKKFNEDTLDSVRGIANVLESKGWSSADAIIEAARRVCDPTGELTGGNAGKNGTKAKKAAAVQTRADARNGKDTRSQREKLRDLRRLKRNPPNTNKAGVANRNAVDADETDDPSSMTEGRVRRMSEQEKRVARGDFVGTRPRSKQRGR